MSKNKIKNLIIFILLIVIIGFSIYRLIGSSQNNKSNILFESLFRFQTKLSEYIGKIENDTYYSYTREQLIIGSSDLKDIENSKIKDYKENEIYSLVDFKTKITKDNTNFYKVNYTNVEKALNVELNAELGIDFYISGNGNVAVKYNDKPTWWIDEFNTICIN